MRAIRDRIRPVGARAGFSLMELLLVLSLLAVVTAIAMPTVSRSLTSVRADRAAALVGGDMKLAFSLAARQNRPVRLTLTAAQRQYTIADRASGTVIHRRSFGTGAGDLTASSLAATATTVDVFPNGIASTSVTYTLRIGGQRRTISMTRTGQVTVQ